LEQHVSLAPAHIENPFVLLYREAALARGPPLFS
jgi:hypothetical protein